MPERQVGKRKGRKLQMLNTSTGLLCKTHLSSLSRKNRIDMIIKKTFRSPKNDLGSRSAPGSRAMITSSKNQTPLGASVCPASGGKGSAQRQIPR